MVCAFNAASGQQTRIAAGRVLRPAPTKGGRPLPVAGQWVVMHRVGSDNAAPLDSVRSAADGRFQFRYSRFGAPDALYFVSARYAGIAYFSPPLRADNVRGGDADVIVYDTTVDTTDLHLQGRHFVLSSPRGERREVAEVFEIDNDGTRTVVARDSVTPIWALHLPAEAESISVAPSDITAGALQFRNGRAEVFAPFSPGIRQLAITYKVPVSAFPLAQPIERSAAVLEVLLEEPNARVEGARLIEVQAATIDGRTFRRFLSQNAPGTAVIRIVAPEPGGKSRAAQRVLAVVLAALMLAALGFWYTRRARPRVRVVTGPPMSEQLIAELALLDATHERSGDASPAARAAYDQNRAALKERIAGALAAENHRP